MEKPKPESQPPQPYFETAVRREYNPSPQSTLWEIKRQPVESLPQLTAEQWQMMTDLGNDELTPENLSRRGLPLGDGPVAVSVDGEQRFIDISLADYGTVLPAKRIEFIDDSSDDPSQPERHEGAEIKAVTDDIGAEALEASGLKEPKLEVKLKPANIARAGEQISRIIGAESGQGNAVARVLAELGSQPEEIRQALDPNSGDPEGRQALLLALEREIDNLGEAHQLPERVQDNRLGDEKHAVSGFGHDKAKYPPREYAARLARAMLDGSFDYDRASRDHYDDLPADHPHNGQHRQAARLVLESSYQETAPDQSETAEVENERLKSYLYGLRTTLPTSIDSMNFVSHPLLEQLKDGLYRDIVDTNTVAEEAVQLTSRVEAALGQLSADSYSLKNLLNQNLDLLPAERLTAEQADAELSTIVSQLDNLRDNPVYYRLQATIHNADAMNLVALKGHLNNGDFDEFSRHIQTLRARLEALSQLAS